MAGNHYWSSCFWYAECFGKRSPVSFATLMVHVDVEPKSDARVRLAAKLADRFATTLIGISACILPPYPAEGAYFVTKEFVEQERHDMMASLKRTEAAFRTAAG